MEAQPERRLYQPGELPALLQLTPEQVDHLIRTGQLCTIRICGEDRVDSREVDRLINIYRQVAERRNQLYVQSSRFSRSSALTISHRRSRPRS
jgi:hypothetical protein